MSALALPAAETVQAHRRERSGAARAEARRRLRARAEPIGVFLIGAVVLTLLGVRSTHDLHLVYPEAWTRLAHTYIAWWNDPPRFRAIGFTYPPLQSVALLPFALLKPLATSLIALPLFSGLCAGVVLATLGRTLAVLGLDLGTRLALLLVFSLNPLFLDYGANGMATMLVMALLAAGLHNFTVWYVRGADSVRSLAFAGSWLAIAFLARYETALWLALLVVVVAGVRLTRGASLVEVVALEAILLAPLVYIFLIWSGVSSLVGGGTFLSWITRAGAEHIVGLGFAGRNSFGPRAVGVLGVLWRSSPMLIVVPGLATLSAVVLRRPFMLVVAASVLVGAAAAILRMAVTPNAELFQPSYEMVALVPMLIGTGWLISLSRGLASGSNSSVRLLATGLALVGLAVSAVTAYDLMRHDTNQYDRAFTELLASDLGRIDARGVRTDAVSPADVYADNEALATFLRAAVYRPKVVLIDELAFPGIVLAADTTLPFRTQAENGSAFWSRVLDHPRGRAKIEYLVVANPRLAVPGYPADGIISRYPGAYAGRLDHSAVIYRNQLAAVVELLPRRSTTQSLLPAGDAALLNLYRNLPSLSDQLH